MRLGDLDFYRHVNNGVYLQMMDVARSNFLADLGAFPLLNGRGWYPVVASSTVSYRRSLTLGQRFEISTRLLGGTLGARTSSRRSRAAASTWPAA